MARQLLRRLTALGTCVLVSAVRETVQDDALEQSPGALICNAVVGAIPRVSKPSECKCGDYEYVYCGYKAVSGLRNFLPLAIQTHLHCKGETPYCAKGPERPPLKKILREDDCLEWAIFSVNRITVAASYSDYLRLSLDLSVVATVLPGGLKYKSKILKNTRAGNPELHFLVPPDTKTVQLQVIDHGNTVGVALNVQTRPPREIWESGLQKIYGSKTFATVTVQALENAKLQRKLEGLVGRGVELTEAYHPMFDPPETTSQQMDVVSYYKKWAQYRSAGYKEEEVPASAMWKKLENGCYDKCQLAPISPNSTKVIGYAYAVRAMKQMGPKLQCGNLFRRNEFGANILNENWWPEKPSHSIGLADNEVDHALSRKWVDRLVGPAVADKPETVEMILKEATKLWEGDQVSLEQALKWTTVILHRLLAFMEVSDTEADELLTHKESATVGMMLPTWLGKQFCGDAMQWKARRLPVYRKAMADHFGAEWTEGLSELQQTKLASGIMDALLFAGGISVPAVIRTCFGVLYSAYGQGQTKAQFGADWHLSEEQLEPFVYETTRRFPPVGGFPAWDRGTNSKVSVDLRGANADKSEEGWGPNARNFWVRELSEYEEKSISWGDFAIVNGDNGHPGSRACAAKRLSLIMVREFLRAFLRRGGTRCWAPTKQEDVKLGGQGGSAFTVKRQVGCA